MNLFQIVFRFDRGEVAPPPAAIVPARSSTSQHLSAASIPATDAAPRDAVGLPAGEESPIESAPAVG
jgi:hypothetical protein